MVESLSVTGSRVGGFGKGNPKRSDALVKCRGLGGNPSSLAKKKAAPNPKPPKTDIFAAQK